jgi:hypothetical protein
VDIGWHTGPSKEDINARRVALCYNAIKGTEQIVSLQTGVAVNEVCGNSEGKYFNANTGLQACYLM